MEQLPLSPLDKVEEIEKILAEDEVDLWALRELCLSEGGLVNDSFRREVWPMLVGIDTIPDLSAHSMTGRNETYHHIDGIEIIDQSLLTQKGFKKQAIAKCIDYRQIDLDIARCTWHLLNGSQRSRRRQMRNKHKKKVSLLLKRKQRRLGNLINLVLIQSYANCLNDFEEERLRYYQGYHDISCIVLNALGGVSNPYAHLNEKKMNKNDNSSDILLDQCVAAARTAEVLGLDLPGKVLLQISQTHLRDCMKSSFQNLTSALRLIVMPLIFHFDPEVHDYLEMCEMEPLFCFPWIISWFSHDIRDTTLVKRLFDVFIVSHPLMPIYMSIAMVLHPFNREEILNTECDFASLHKTISQLPRNSCSVGWKFVGDGFGGSYVSGDEEDEKKMSLDAGSMMSDDIDRESINGDESSLATSLSGSVFDSSPVPFQELIDLSIKFMRRIPPQHLSKLARHYHGDELHMFTSVDSINLFQHPPKWAMRASAPSLYKCSKDQSQSNCMSPSEINKATAEMIYPRATIACGLGKGEIKSKMKLLKRRRLQFGAILVGIVAIYIGILIRCQNEDLVMPPVVSTCKSFTHTVLDGIETMFVSQKSQSRENSYNSKDGVFHLKSILKGKIRPDKGTESQKVSSRPGFKPNMKQVDADISAMKPVRANDNGMSSKNDNKHYHDEEDQSIISKKYRNNPVQILRNFAEIWKSELLGPSSQYH